MRHALVQRRKRSELLCIFVSLIVAKREESAGEAAKIPAKMSAPIAVPTSSFFLSRMRNPAQMNAAIGTASHAPRVPLKRSAIHPITSVIAVGSR